MADANRIRPAVRGLGFTEKQPHEKRALRAPGENEIVYEKLVDGDRYIGTVEALANAGMIPGHFLAAGEGRGDASLTVTAQTGSTPDQSFIGIAGKDARLFEVRIGISKEESGRREGARQKRLQAENAAKELEVALEREARELSALPRSHEQYRNHCVRTLQAHIKIVRDTAIIANKYSGFHFDTLAVRAFDEATKQLLKTLQYGGTVFDAGTQERRIIDIKVPSSKANQPLQDFLQSVTSWSGDARQSTADDEGA